MAALNRIRLLDPIPENLIQGDSITFLQGLGGPSCLVIPGLDTSRWRGFVTLLHGNEPSGMLALHRYLRSGQQPAVNVVCIVASVEAALAHPRFSQRMPAGHRDLNRCFRPPFDDEQGALAQEIVETLARYQPEAVVDMHNTSGSGPAFGVVAYSDAQRDALVSLFTQRVIETGMRLGALMEVDDMSFPIVTVEVGGRLDDSAHDLAYEGLCEYLHAEQVLSPLPADWDLERLSNPVRLELKPQTRLIYADQFDPDYDLTLKTDVERYNFGSVRAGTELGWSARQADELFQAQDRQGYCVLEQLVEVKRGVLRTTSDLKLFMVTNNAQIAKSDCLFYAVADDGQAVCAPVIIAEGQ